MKTVPVIKFRSCRQFASIFLYARTEVITDISCADRTFVARVEFLRSPYLSFTTNDPASTGDPQEIPAWNSLTSEQQQLYGHMMEVFAGYSAHHIDYQIGHLVDAINELGELDNTLIIYIVGDNGASAEGNLAGLVNEVLDMNANLENRGI